MTILVVDDSAMMRSMVRSAIQAYGSTTAEIIEARDGEEAFQILRSRSIELLLVDWNMPRLDGVALVQRVRASGWKSPIVMVTSVHDPAKALEAARAGVSDYVTKPFQMLDLWNRISKFIT